MTLNELTTMIAGRFGKEKDINYRQWLVPHINTWRSRLIRNSLEKNPKERYPFLQTITIPMIYGPVTCGDMVCNGSMSGTLPRILRIGLSPFDYLGGIDGSSPYRFNDPGTGAYIKEGKLAHKFHFYEVTNNKVIIPYKRIPQIQGSTIFDEPEKAMEWECHASGTTGCDWWNTEYPLSGDIIEMIKTAIFDELKTPNEVLPEKQDQDA